MPVAHKPPRAGPGSVVLDTNVVLDAWVFDEPAARTLRAALVSRSIRWVTSEAIVAEWRRVAQRCDGPGSRLPLDEVLAHIELHPPAPPAPAGLRCHDPSDQKFIDLALACAAGWLLTRDRALLALRRRASALGLSVATPAQWERATRPPRADA